MKFQPGQSGNPKGRAKGSTNKKTEEIKQAYVDLIYGNLDNIKLWLSRVAETDPARALELSLKLSPFIIPKKMEQDITIENPINIVLPKRKEEKEDKPEQEDKTDE